MAAARGSKNVLFVHGHNGADGKSRTYNSWDNMIARCRRKSCPSYKYYGARGITVCERCLKFKNFLADMGESSEGLSIERVNGTLGYFKDNCRWANDFEQQSNTVRNVYVSWKGETLILSEWARRLGVRRQVLGYRYRHGLWPK
jgi:hypothetical protein